MLLPWGVDWWETVRPPLNPVELERTVAMGNGIPSLPEPGDGYLRDKIIAEDPCDLRRDIWWGSCLWKNKLSSTRCWYIAGVDRLFQHRRGRCCGSWENE